MGTADDILKELNDQKLREEVQSMAERTGLPLDLALVAVRSGEEGEEILINNFQKLQARREAAEQADAALILNLRQKYRELILQGNAREAISVKNRLHELGGTV